MLKTNHNLFDPGRRTVCCSQSVLLSGLLLLYLFVCSFDLWFNSTFAFPCQSPAYLLSFFFLNDSTYSLICTSLPLPLVPLDVISDVFPLLAFSFIQCLFKSLLLIFPFSIPLTLSSSPSLLPLFPRVTLDPSKRQSSNKSMSGCTLPQGTKTVSKSSSPMFSGCFCLPVCLPACQCPVIPSFTVCRGLEFGYANMCLRQSYSTGRRSISGWLALNLQTSGSTNSQSELMWTGTPLLLQYSNNTK